MEACVGRTPSDKGRFFDRAEGTMSAKIMEFSRLKAEPAGTIGAQLDRS